MSYSNFFLNQKGFSLLASVLAMLGLSVMGLVFASAVTQHQYSAVNQLLSTQVLYIAEAGFELAIQERLDNQDYAFNGVSADGVIGGIGGITSVPIGAGSVKVTKGTESPPVFTATATVGDVTRVVAMTLDVRNLIKRDPFFEDAANLGNNWPEAPPTQVEGGSGIAADGGNNRLKVWTTPGNNQDFISYREQAVDYNDTLLGEQPVPPNSRVGVRLNYMRDYTGSVNRHTLKLQLVKSDGTTQEPFSIGPSSVPDAEKGAWLLADIRGWPTDSLLTTDKVRLFYDLGTTGSGGQAFGWFDNIQVNIVKKGIWNEP